MDGPDSKVVVHGVVSPDRSEAIFAQAALDSLYPDPAGRLRFRGLDPEARYHVAPVFTGPTPSGLAPPEWWGQPKAAGVHIERTSLRAAVQNGVSFPGAVFAGSSLEKVGVASPRIHPDQVVLYRLSKVA
ncbi:GH36 C-terminal domain-containing protein [Arthrobacter sp. CC3]|uniref:GH36 C-terminal domain-containing protein n=1 Tax=Arthrobacter sp. CC3 TaxID=3029185 RepID=UPI0032645FAE